MKVSEELKKDVAERNIAAIRDDLWSCIAFDSNFTREFKWAWDYCLEKGITEQEIYEPHDGRNLSSEANKENFDKLCGELGSNFSKERLDKIREIGRKIYPMTQNDGEQSRETVKEKKTKQIDDKSLAIGTAAVAIAGCIVATAVTGKIFAGVAVGAAAGYAYKKAKELL